MFVEQPLVSPGSYNYLKATRINKCSLCVQVSGEDSYDKSRDNLVGSIVVLNNQVLHLKIYLHDGKGCV